VVRDGLQSLAHSPLAGEDRPHTRALPGRRPQYGACYDRTDQNRLAHPRSPPRLSAKAGRTSETPWQRLGGRGIVRAQGRTGRELIRSAHVASRVLAQR
jgi:hypothetical protein